MKGFTLIELLAVIVILAIILMIATPMVMNVINSAKESAAHSSVKMFVRQAEQQYMMNQFVAGSLVVTPVTNVFNDQLVNVDPKPTPSNPAITMVNGKVTGTVAYNGYVFDVVAGEVTKTPITTP